MAAEPVAAAANAVVVVVAVGAVARVFRRFPVPAAVVEADAAAVAVVVWRLSVDQPVAAALKPSVTACSFR